MKIFGCEAYAHIPKQQRKKWDLKSKKLIFVGYHGDSKNYRLIDPETNRITISRDVNFNEYAESKFESPVASLSFPSERAISNDRQPEQTDDCSQREASQCKNVQREVESDVVNVRSNLRDRSLLRAPCRYEACFVSYAEPKTYNEAVTGKNSEKWIQAVREELAAHQQNQTWEIVPLPRDRKAIRH